MKTTLTISHPRIASGALFLAIGVFGAVYAAQYRLGNATTMGPGYYPMGVSLILALLGTITMLDGLQRWWRTRAGAVSESGARAASESWDDAGLRDAPVQFDARALIVVVGIVAFGFAIRRFGLVPAVGALSLILCVQRWRSRPVETVVIAVLLSVITGLLFISLLGMPFAWVRWS